MTTMRLVLEYDGTDFHGWQAQPGMRTVEGALRSAVERVTGELPRFTAAGRTDAGAHSHGQVVGLALQRQWQPERLSTALNAVLPDDVAVQAAASAPADFHARYDALERTYRYLVVSRRERSPATRRFAWQVAAELDTPAMEQAASLLHGRHDFAALGRSPREGGSTVRTISRVRLRRISVLDDDHLRAHVIEVSADAFLHGMMRGIAGMLVAVGRARMDVADVTALLAGDDPRRQFPVAPARGLHQWRVTYPAPPAVDATVETSQETSR